MLGLKASFDVIGIITETKIFPPKNGRTSAKITVGTGTDRFDFWVDELQRIQSGELTADVRVQIRGRIGAQGYQPKLYADQIAVLGDKQPTKAA